jgi:hypothetical protein
MYLILNNLPHGYDAFHLQFLNSKIKLTKGINGRWITGITTNITD